MPYYDDRQLVFSEENPNKIVTYEEDIPKRKAINYIYEIHDVERPIEKISKE